MRFNWNYWPLRSEEATASIASMVATPMLSIAHWKALGESYLLSHKSSSGGGGGGGSMKELWPPEEKRVKW